MSLCGQKSMCGDLEFAALSRQVAARLKRTYKGEVKLGKSEREMQRFHYRQSNLLKYVLIYDKNCKDKKIIGYVSFEHREGTYKQLLVIITHSGNILLT